MFSAAQSCLDNGMSGPFFRGLWRSEETLSWSVPGAQPRFLKDYKDFSKVSPMFIRAELCLYIAMLAFRHRAPHTHLVLS